jgi:hypothetical protein
MRRRHVEPIAQPAPCFGIADAGTSLARCDQNKSVKEIIK